MMYVYGLVATSMSLRFSREKNGRSRRAEWGGRIASDRDAVRDLPNWAIYQWFWNRKIVSNHTAIFLWLNQVRKNKKIYKQPEAHVTKTVNRDQNSVDPSIHSNTQKTYWRFFDMSWKGYDKKVNGALLEKLNLKNGRRRRKV